VELICNRSSGTCFLVHMPTFRFHSRIFLDKLNNCQLEQTFAYQVGRLVSSFPFVTLRPRNRREGDHWGDLGIDGWIILEWISRRWDVGIWTGLG